MEQLSLRLPAFSCPENESSRPLDLQFDRIQPSDQHLVDKKKFEFGQFVAREAMLDEEYWVGSQFYLGISNLDRIVFKLFALLYNFCGGCGAFEFVVDSRMVTR